MNAIFEIFITFMKVGGFSFGGGLAMLPLIEKEVVINHQWLTAKEFVDIIAIAEMTPGPIAINTSTFVGYKVAGYWGALAGSIGVTIVSFILVILVARYFLRIKDAKETKAIFEGIRPAVLGMILSAGVSVGRTAFVDYKSVFIALLVLFSINKLKLHPILSILGAGVLGILLY